MAVITGRFGVLLAGISLFLSLLSSTVFAEKDVSLADAASREAVAAAETIRELAMIESGSNDLEGLTTIAGNLDDRLVKLGFQTERYTSPVDVGADSVVGKVKGTGTQRVMLMAHMDTVFERGILGEMPVRQEENKLFGPGVLDAKGGIAVILHSLSILADRGWRDYETLTVLFNPDEEIGSAGSGALISKFASQSDTVLSFEVGGDGARGMAWILAGTASYAQVTLEVRGLASHAGIAPEQGRNAVLELAHQILSTRDVANSIEGVQLNWTNVVSDKAYNQIPALATAVADARITRDGAEMELLEALKAKVAESTLIAGTEVSAKLEILRPGFRASPESWAVAELANEVFREISKLPLYVVPMAKGATDAGYAAKPGTAVVLEGFGPSGRGIHSRDELVEVDSVAPSLYQVTRLLIELGERHGK
ncbi:glutamate carboxypeptidase [Pseudomonadota bacterium]